MNCLNCNKETTNPKFCSKSCAATHNNRNFPKRKPENKCLVCTTPISNSRTYCKSCFGSHRKGLNLNVTLEEAMYNKHHRSSAYALVRARARAVAAKLDWSCCINCGYNKHVEIAHRKAISSFPHETLVNDINSVDNLVPLCPNCHWEFDHNLLSLP